MKILIFLSFLPIMVHGQSQVVSYELNFHEQLFRQNLVQRNSETTAYNVYLHGLVGSLTVGIFGALIGTQLHTECAGSSDVLLVCQGTERYTHHGAAIGGTLGSSISLLHYTKKRKVQRKNLKIVLGSAAGGLAGFLLSKKTYALSSILLPPLGATIALSF